MPTWALFDDLGPLASPKAHELLDRYAHSPHSFCTQAAVREHNRVVAIPPPPALPADIRINGHGVENHAERCYAAERRFGLVDELLC
mmetsp:Transcript_5538/g.11528  ORF Transcript_5538/g.11528 Transcript_5538/m.11528 type:complete len:87 (+) Transcript_5538:725-985(+)